MTWFYSFQSEWLKTRRSAAMWLTVLGACLIPFIVVVDRLVHFDGLYHASQHAKLWEHVFFQCWRITCLMLLPLGIIMATSLVAQLEYRNNAWKQVLTTPQSLTLLFFVKFFVLIVMLVRFFILFNLGIYLCGVLPSLVYRGIPFPKESIPFLAFLKLNFTYFMDGLPIVALQFLVSIRFKNFLVPMGIGIGLYIASMIAASWKYAYWVPYTYNALNFGPSNNASAITVNWHFWALGYFVILTLLGYILFVTKKEKG